MKLGDKLRSLRAVEGSLRGLGRTMTQQELAAAMKREIGRGLSQAYLSQIENAGVAIGIEGNRREDRFVALCRRRAVHGGSGAATRTAGRCRGGGFTQGRAAAGGDSPHTRPG